MGQLDSLLKLLLSPVGIVGVFAGILAISYTAKRPKAIWLLIGGCMFCASLARYSDAFMTAPPLFAPFEMLRSMGRPITMGLLLLIFIATFFLPKKVTPGMPVPLRGLLVVQYLIMLKTIYYGNLTFSIIYFLLFLFILYTLCNGLGGQVRDWNDFDDLAGAVALAGLLFVWINTFQGVINRNAIVFIQGRFSGTTGNPNHAAVFLATVFPALLYQVTKSKQNKVRLFWMATAALAFYWLLISGSRTGLIMVVISFLLFFSNKVLPLLIRIIALCFAVAAFHFLFPGIIDFAIITETIGWDQMAARLERNSEGGLDTRAEIWQIQFNYFKRYPIFGAPVDGDRIIFGENSWLGVASQFGWIGLIPMLFFGIGTSYRIVKLWGKRSLLPQFSNQFSLCFAGLIALMIGSVNEAYLLGSLSFPIMSLITYLILSEKALALSSKDEELLENENFVPPHHKLP